VIAAVLRAARHLQVEQHLGVAGRLCHAPQYDLPFLRFVRIGDADGREAVIEPFEVIAQAERSATMHGITSYTPSANRKPRSRGEMRASASGSSVPFR